jgi:hypothetical protein
LALFSAIVKGEEEKRDVIGEEEHRDIVWEDVGSVRITRPAI